MQTRENVIKQITLLDKENFKLLSALKESYSDEKEIITEVQNDITSGFFPFAINELNIKGTDLIAVGLQGKIIGQTLDLLLSLVQNKKLHNEKDVLLKWVKDNLHQLPTILSLS